MLLERPMSSWDQYCFYFPLQKLAAAAHTPPKAHSSCHFCKSQHSYSSDDYTSLQKLEVSFGQVISKDRCCGQIQPIPSILRFRWLLFAFPEFDHCLGVFTSARGGFSQSRQPCYDCKRIILLGCAVSNLDLKLCICIHGHFLSYSKIECVQILFNRVIVACFTVRLICDCLDIVTLLQFETEPTVSEALK
jgi:hypothetical protein